MNEVYTNIWVSDIRDAQTHPKDDFDRIITVCQDPIEDNVSDGCAYEWYNMSDGEAEYGGDDSQELFDDAVRSVLASFMCRETILVHCHAGQSRSVSVVAAAITVIEHNHHLDNKNLDEMLNLVQSRRGDVQTNPLMVEKAESFVGRYT